MRSCTLLLLLSVPLGLMLLSGCGGSVQPDPPAPGPLSASNLNLIFVVSEDLLYQSPGDINEQTANLTSRGLQRSLLMATFLKQQVLGSEDVTAIYTLEPMTHLQTARHYPDMVALETVQQFATLNPIELSYKSYPPVTANSYPLNVSYASAPLPDGVAPPLFTCAGCQGLDFRDMDGANEALVGDILRTNRAGFYVFSAPWETISSLMANINRREGYSLTFPSRYPGPNYVFAISITPSGSATLATYNSHTDPASNYPIMPAGGIVSAACLPSTTHTEFHVQMTGGVGGAVIPAGINTNETVYLVRHAEAHPQPWWEDGNFIGAGQWRALDLPYALRGKIHPTLVLSIDPAQVIQGSSGPLGDAYSYVRTNTTVLPYAIANNLPFRLAASFEMAAQNPPQLATQASDFFFTGGNFSNQSLLVGWEHDHIPPTVNALLAMYHGGQSVPNWPGDDYDTVWTVKLDAHGNVSVDNSICEGISSKALPAAPPEF